MPGANDGTGGDRPDPVRGMPHGLDARKAAFHQAEQAAANLTLSLEREIARNIEIYDLSLESGGGQPWHPGP